MSLRNTIPEAFELAAAIGGVQHGSLAPISSFCVASQSEGLGYSCLVKKTLTTYLYHCECLQIIQTENFIM